MIINKVINKTRKLIEAKKNKASTKKTLLKLEKNNDADIKKMSATINFIIANNNWENKDIAAFKEVNKLERKYLASTDQISFKDYGAGSSESKRKNEEMIEGITSINSVSNIFQLASSKEKWGKLIFKIVKDFKPTNCLELGTCLGISASYQILALKLNNKGKFTTIEGATELAKIADENLKNLEYPNYSVHIGKFLDVLPNLLSKDNPYDMVFIDGHHDKEATQEYFELLYPFLAKKSILIFDDINWSTGMKAVWSDIYNDERIKFSFDMHNWGICFIDKGANKLSKDYFKIQI